MCSFLKPRAKCLAFDKHTSGTSVKKKKLLSWNSSSAFMCIHKPQILYITPHSLYSTDKSNWFSSPQTLNIKQFSRNRKLQVQCLRLKSSVLSVFVDPKYPYSMKLRQLWEEDAKEGACVDEEMCGIIFCVETGENIPAEREKCQCSINTSKQTQILKYIIKKWK